VVRHEARARREHRQVDAALDHLRELVRLDGFAQLVVADASGAVLLANARLRSMLGADASAQGPLTIDDLRHSAAAPLLGVLGQAARERRLVERELSLTAAGDTHAWQVVAFPIRRESDGVAATGIIATDLTERARAEESRRAQDAKHQQAQKLESLGIMAGGIAHDFNNLLGAILGNVEIAISADDDPATRRSSLEQIAAASRRAAELTRQMLAYAGRASLKRETVDIRTVVDDLLPLVRAAQSKKVEFVVEMQERALRVELDPAQLSQVVLNLLTNAAEAIGDRPGVVTLRTERVARPVGAESAQATWIRLVVSDSGDGISPELLERIFDPFFTTKDSGRGLGLSAVRGIVHSLGGYLHVDSELGRGTRFEVLLPAAADTAESPSAVAALQERRWSGTVLVVDDEDALRRVSRIVLEKMGLDVLEAEDGIAGLERFRSAGGAIRLVILDLTMPGLGGGEVLREIRRVNPTLPVIIASGYDHTDAAALFQQDPYLRFLQKPFNLSALRAAVAASLA
ncbi:MAG TPA: ATP-binding protein, partial [Gemmatimonadaceae bacterium]|nr:ATP-binding protein [Gemmatimonadaceae bacterium]